MAYLEVLKGQHCGKIFELRTERTIIGRHPDCEIVLDSSLVSRQHAQVVNQRGEFVVEDLRSRNRTFLNGIPIPAKTVLHHADEIRIGDVLFRFIETRARDSTGSGLGRKSTRSGPISTAQQAAAASSESASPLDSDVSSSTVVISLNAKRAPELRLGVKPEAKLRAMLEVSNALVHTIGVDDVLQTLLNALLKVFPQVDSGLIKLIEGEERVATLSPSESAMGNKAGFVRMDTATFHHAIDTGEAILSTCESTGRSNSDESRGPAAEGTLMSFPLIGKEGRAIGVIQLKSKTMGPQLTQEAHDDKDTPRPHPLHAIENARLHEDLLRRSDFERELSFASEVQLSFLPNHRPHPPGYECFDYYEPARLVGGDYFDYVSLPDGRVAIGLADVAGKGMPAALLMARLYSAVRLQLFTQPSPAKVLAALNDESFVQGLGHRFITFVLLMLNPRTHELTIANAGHMPPIIRSPAGKATSFGVRDSGMPFGISRNQDFRELRISMEPGTSVILYTDGVTDAMNPADELFGRAKLEQVVTAAAPSAGDLIKSIVKEVDRFCGARLQHDDMCLVCVRRSPNSESDEGAPLPQRASGSNSNQCKPQ